MAYSALSVNVVRGDSGVKGSLTTVSGFEPGAPANGPHRRNVAELVWRPIDTRIIQVLCSSY